MAAKGKPILLDGGMGQEIVNRGGKGGYGEWAVAALYEDPELVRDIHLDYIRAGADVITTNTYGTTRVACATLTWKTVLKSWCAPPAPWPERRAR